MWCVCVYFENGEKKQKKKKERQKILFFATFVEEQLHKKYRCVKVDKESRTALRKMYLHPTRCRVFQIHHKRKRNAKGDTKIKKGRRNVEISISYLDKKGRGKRNNKRNGSTRDYGHRLVTGERSSVFFFHLKARRVSPAFYHFGSFFVLFQFSLGFG